MKPKATSRGATEEGAERLEAMINRYIHLRRKARDVWDRRQNITLHNIHYAHFLLGGQEDPRPRHDWAECAEADLLAEGFAANLSALKPLQQWLGLSSAEVAALCGVSLRTYRRWLSGGNPPAAALRLLAILAGFVPWDGWDGWEVHRGCLFPPGYTRGGIAPGEFFALVFWRQLVTEYQRRHAQRELAFEREKVAALRDLVRELSDCDDPRLEAAAG